MIVAAIVVAFAMFATSALAYTHTVTLMQGSSGSQVMSLQQALGVTADGSFGPMTKAAVMAFQSANGLTADGVVGPMTGAALGGMAGGGSYPAGCSSSSGYSTITGMSCSSAMSYPAGCTSSSGFSPTTGMSCSSGGSTLPAGCSSTAGFSPTTGMSCSGSSTPSPSGVLTGGAGSVDSYDLASGFSNEEVGEDAEDVKVAGVEIENGDDSDLEFTAVRLVFDEGTAGSDFDNYASEVSLWLGSEEVARVDGDEFNDDNNWTKTVSLDGAVLDSGDTETLYLAISGVNNLDTADAGDTWTVDFTSIRFVDATGASISEDPTVAATTFSFESFATSADTELKVTESGTANELVNDAHLINVDATNTTDNVPLLAFDIEVEGDSDVNIDSLPVTLTSTEAAGTDFDEAGDIVTTLRLFADGVEIGSEAVDGAAAGGADTQVVVFDDLDYDIDAGDKVNFVVKGKFVALSGVLDLDDTIMAAFGETETDLATFDAEDETGENLADADKTGTANSTASTVRDVGFALKFISGTSVVSHVGDIAGSGAGDDDQGTFAIIFDVTAWDGAIYLDGTAPALAGGGVAADVDLNTTGTVALTSATLTSSTGAVLTGTINADARFLVNEDDTERFTITVVSTVSVDGITNLSLTNLGYALTDVDSDILFTFDLVDFKTPDLFLNAN